ncbi:Uncharacterized protein C31F10.16 [Ceratocystis fimbriata CBS 114723]|uniref:Uncharacterized protein C31F10.16 n=1 Tax=Ceratocystis fimbriata CBS 114723 TaxID=1035309 RepID=A0A2C5X1X7_9PEZI|nr:Uncharacterized protein C31F10.16 [Ceratocystis fimbriata CBS 114723]
MVVVPAVPELTEEALHESVESRTESLVSLRELGPPDLVHLVRQGVRNPGKHIGIYHHVTGVDASSSASLAAYINTLTYKESGSQSQSQTKIAEGLYSCYNAFSRVDMRVHVAIPGGVDSYCVDERGEKRKTTDEMWLETYLCSVLRAYFYADDGTGEVTRKIMGVRRFNPVTNTETEHRFLNAAEQLFFRGWQLGSDSVVQVPNIVSNHLTTGLLKYFHTTGRYTSGINLFEKLRSHNVEVASLLAKVLFMGNEEVKGIRVLHQALKESPMDYVMLDTQAEFLLQKALKSETPELKAERLQMALACADRSTIAAPSEFGTWARLAQIYVAMEDWEHALAILNSCPMFTYQDKDAPLMPEPKDVFLPVLADSRLDEIDNENDQRFDQIDPSLLNLRAATYKGTFKEAYKILTEMTSQIGWDQLLKIRSTVFVMEDEYRTEKKEAATPSQPHTRNPSTDGLRGSKDGQENSDTESGVDETIERLDDEDPVDESIVEDFAAADHSDGKTTEIAPDIDSGLDTTSPNSALDAGSTDEADVKSNDVPNNVEKPSIAINGVDDKSKSPSNHFSKLNTKRLCERWLDSLFMVLYEDLRVYTIWRTQMAQYRAQSMQYRKSAEEWEILGALAERLQHTDEAVEAYRACLSMRFSPKALSGISRAFERTKSTRETVAALIRLITWQYRWYSDFSPELLRTIRILIEEEGALKVRSIIQATNMPQNVLDLTHQYAALCATFRSSGTDG